MCSNDTQSRNFLSKKTMFGLSKTKMDKFQDIIFTFELLKYTFKSYVNIFLKQIMQKMKKNSAEKIHHVLCKRNEKLSEKIK